MTLRMVAMLLGIAALLTGCGKHYWQAPNQGYGAFLLDSRECINEATSKYEASERIYRRCMQARGWERVRTQYPTNRQFRGPESEDALLSPPDPLSKRGPNIQGVSGDPDCRYARRPIERPAHCPR